MTKGEIYLYDYDGTVVFTKLYNSNESASWQAILETWTKQVGKIFLRMEVGIIPYANGYINQDGTNSNHRLLHKKETYKRPKKK